MKRLIVLLAVLAGIAWIYNYGGNALDEGEVRDFYGRYEKAFLAQDGETLCAMTAPEFEMAILYRMESRQHRQVTDRERYCKANGEWSAVLRQVGRGGGELPIDFNQSITGIEIAPDEASAKVETRTTMALPGLRMTFRTRDTVVRRRWKTLIAGSEGTAWIGPAYR